jgi:hypothetical protein
MPSGMQAPTSFTAVDVPGIKSHDRNGFTSLTLLKRKYVALSARGLPILRIGAWLLI